MWGEHESMIKPTTFGSLATLPEQMETDTLHASALYIFLYTKRAAVFTIIFIHVVVLFRHRWPLGCKQGKVRLYMPKVVRRS